VSGRSGEFAKLTKVEEFSGMDDILGALDKFGVKRHAMELVKGAVNTVIERRLESKEAKKKVDSEKELDKIVGEYVSGGTNTIEDAYKKLSSNAKLLPEHRSVDVLKDRIVKKGESRLVYDFLHNKNYDVNLGLTRMVKDGVIEEHGRQNMFGRIMDAQNKQVEEIMARVKQKEITYDQAMSLADDYNDEIKRRVEQNIRDGVKGNADLEETATGLLDRMSATGPGELPKNKAIKEVEEMKNRGEITSFEQEELVRQINERSGVLKTIDTTEAAKARTTAESVFTALQGDIDAANLPEEVQRAFREKLTLYKKQESTAIDIAKIEKEASEAEQLNIMWKKIQLISKYCAPALIGVVAGAMVATPIGLISAGFATGLSTVGTGAALGAGSGALAGLVAGSVFGGAKYYIEGRSQMKRLHITELRAMAEIDKIAIDSADMSVEQGAERDKVVAELLSARLGINAEDLLKIVSKRFGTTQVTNLKEQINSLGAVAYNRIMSARGVGEPAKAA